MAKTIKRQTKAPAKKSAAPKAAEKPVEKVLVLRTCDKNLKSHGGFQWHETGVVWCPDWSPKAECGNGLHGLLWGEGDGSLLDWSETAKWLVVEVDADMIVSLGRKVKFPRGNVIHCGDRKSATDLLVSRLTKAASVVGVSLTGGDGSTLTGGYGSTLTGGDRSTLTGGDRSTLTGGYGSTLTGGYGSTLTGGDGSTLTGGYGSTLTGGDWSTLVLSFWNGKRKCLVTLYVGEDGILPNTKYRLNAENKPEVVK